jgi:hypothetical protein
VGVPFAAAQADGPDFTASWDATTKQFRLVAKAGIAPFGESEELIVSGADESVTVTLVDAMHTIVPGAGCTYTPYIADGVLCTAPKSADRTRMTIDLRAATGATTTAVAPASASADQLAITFYGGSGVDYVQGGIADDEIDGGLGDDDLFGGPGNDKIVGNDGADNIDGEEGDDALGGGAGNDIVTGDVGLDSMTGGSGINELDSEDGFPDTYVNCDNAPGEGKIAFDRGLDIPRNCPVVLPPTAPTKLEAAGGRDSLTVSWAPPDFDGNATQLTYELYYRAPGKSTDTKVSVPGDESSYTLGDLRNAPGLYSVSMRAKNEAGTSAATTSVPVVVGGAPSPPQSVASVFVRRGSATVSWVPPADVTGATYELALRVMDKERKTWLAWTTLPDKVSGTSLAVGDDLRIVSGRVYQFRVRTVTDKGDVSTWTDSPRRFAGNLEPLETATVKGRGPVSVSVNAPGLAWRYNVDISALTASMTADSYQALPIAYASIMLKPTFVRYSAEMPGPLTLTSGCYVGLNYRLPGSTKVERMRADITCPK